MVKVLVTGANSYVGADIYEKLSKKYETVGTYNKNQLFPALRQLDITDRVQMIRLVQEVKPDVIVHVAGTPTAKSFMTDEHKAIATNVTATGDLALIAKSLGSTIIFISSTAAMSPVDMYGESKMEAEKLVKDSYAKYVILRPAFILGASPNTTSDRQQNRLLKNIIEGTPAVYGYATMQVTLLEHISQVIIECIDRPIENQTIEIVTEARNSRFKISSDILSNFGITCMPNEKEQPSKDSIFADTHSLRRLNLPIYTYEEAIEKVVAQMKEQVRQIKGLTCTP
jgi:dTDP-4-dehydrorhamnose reductase